MSKSSCQSKITKHQHKLCTSHYLRYDVLYSYVLLRLRYWAEYAQRNEDELLEILIQSGAKEKAFYWFDKVLEQGESADEFAYWKTRTQRMKLCSQLGKNEENIKEQQKIIENNPGNVNEWSLLLASYMYAGRYEEAYEEFKKAVENFPDEWELYIHGGDISKKFGKYDEALEHYNKAGEIGSNFCDELYCKASLYEDLGEYEKSVEMYMKIADTLRKRGYDIEADMAEKDAEEVKRKIEK